jgi:hypothetical protein
VNGPARLPRTGAALPPTPGRSDHRRYLLGGAGVRLVILLAGLALLAIPAEPNLVWVVLTVAGVLVAVGSPGQGGAGLALGASIGSWIAAYGWEGAPPLGATVEFALALYLLHTSTALAAAVPLGVQLRAPVLRRWLRRCLLELAVAAALGAASYGFGRPGSSSVLQLLGLLGVLVLAGVPVLLLHRYRD